MVENMTKKRSRRRCSSCGNRFYPKKYQRVCDSCQDYKYWNTSIGSKVESQLKRMKYEDQLQQTDLDGVTSLYKKLKKYQGWYSKDGEFRPNLELELSHLYPASKGGLLTPNNLVIAPKSLNRLYRDELFPIGEYADESPIESDYREWAAQEYSLKGLIEKYHLSPKSKKAASVKDFEPREFYTLDELLISEAERLGFVLTRLDIAGWKDLMEGRLEPVSVDNPHWITPELIRDNYLSKPINIYLDELKESELRQSEYEVRNKKALALLDEHNKRHEEQLLYPKPFQAQPEPLPF